jgi:hypothetical protein
MPACGAAGTPAGDQAGCPTLVSGGVPARRCTCQLRRSSTKIPGSRFPVYSSPQSSCSMSNSECCHLHALFPVHMLQIEQSSAFPIASTHAAN